MRLLAAALLALASGASSQNVVQLGVTKGLPGINIGSGPSLARRGTYSEQLINHIAGGGYYVQVKVGTPPQNLTMLLDTGSSDTWVLSEDADLCTNEDLQQLYGLGPCIDTFDRSESSTSKMVEEGGFNITYLDGKKAWGDYISDNLAIGGTTVESLQMAYVTKAVRVTGILGLGFSASERAATKYPNFIDEMVNQGSIGCKAYSLYLNDRRTDSGAILFGGIDTDKFIGPLEILPLHKPKEGNYSSFEINFTDVSLSFTNGTQLEIPTSILDHPAPAVLDSGTTLSYLPDKMAQKIFSALGAIFDATFDMTIIDCAYLTPQSSPLSHLTFTFSPTTTITVPVVELILDILPAQYPAPPQFSGSNKACVFGIQSTDIFKATGTSPQSNFTLLGDTFLRSAYVVYDLTHYQIGMAQANLNSTTSTVIELSGTGTSLPSLTGVTAQQTTFTPTSTAGTFGRTGIGGGFGGDGNGGIGDGSGPGENAAGWADPRRRIPLGEMAGVAFVTGLFVLLGGALVVV